MKSPLVDEKNCILQAAAYFAMSSLVKVEGILPSPILLLTKTLPKSCGRFTASLLVLASCKLLLLQFVAATKSTTAIDLKYDGIHSNNMAVASTRKNH